MDNVISLNRFVAKKEQSKKEAEQAEYDALYNFISEIPEYGAMIEISKKH